VALHDPTRPGALVDEAAFLKRVRDNIAFAAVGHADAIAHARVRDILAVAEERPGYGVSVERQTTHHPQCGGLGVLYEMNEARYTITIRECSCVKYVLRYIPLPAVPFDPEAQ
jgi:hypothetical protein